MPRHSPLAPNPFCAAPATKGLLARRRYGKIFEHESASSFMDGRPAVVLVVRYMKRKQIEEVRLDTGTSERERFPIGYTVAFRFSNGQPVLVPNSVSQKKLRHEEDLMNPDLGPGQKASS